MSATSFASAVSSNFRPRYATAGRANSADTRSGNSFGVSQPTSAPGGPVAMRSSARVMRGQPASCSGILPFAKSGAPTYSFNSRGSSGSPSGRFSRTTTVIAVAVAGSRPCAFGSAL